jgi:hypothetical protein
MHDGREAVKHSVFVSVAGWFAALGCAAAPPRVLPSEVLRAEVLPADHETVGSASASCESRAQWGKRSGVPLTSFECTDAELERALVARAAAASAPVLVGVSCGDDSRGARVCSATLARPSEPAPARPAAARERPQRDEEKLSFAARKRIEVDIEPTRANFARRPRTASEVAEARGLPVSHVELGSLRARCDEAECDSADLRIALRVAAGGLGVSDLVDVSCATLDGERECLATLAASELDPETDPRAR